MNKKSKGISVWRMVSRVLPQIASASPVLFAFYTMLFIFDGLVGAAFVFFMQGLFDSVTALSLNKGTLQGAMVALVVVVGVKLLEQVINGLDGFIGEIYFMRAYRTMLYKVNLKLGRLDPIAFENSETLDHINKCQSGVMASLKFVNTIIDIGTFYIPYFLFMGAYLFWLKPILAISLILIFVPVLLSKVISSKLFARLEDASAPLRRKVKYYEGCVVSREYVKESRILGACPYFITLLKDSLVVMNSLTGKTNIKSNLIELGGKLISLGGYMGILWLLFNALMNKEISVGAFAAVFASIGSMFELMEEVVCNRLGTCAKNFGKVQNYLRFLDLPEREGSELQEGEIIIHGNIVLEDVTFRYPLSDKNAVEDINLQINKGETIAIVGENGSGKSTLIRLITGLYIPQRGRVTHNNKSTKDISPKALFQGISGIFQKFNKYQLTLKENIMISQMGDNKGEEHFEKALSQGGIKLDKEIFPDGSETMLSREFDGVDLSGGQWQKVAIGRGFYRDHELIVLDEPTAAIDPLEETKVYERFAAISKGKTSVIVTHRLGSVKFANRIIVMEEGHIVGVGTHDILLSSCKAYEKMWNSQAQYYTTTNLKA